MLETNTIAPPRAPELFEHAADRGGVLGLIRDVDGVGDGFDAGAHGAAGVDRLFERGGVTAEERHVRALTREIDGDGPADPPARARDERDFPRERHYTRSVSSCAISFAMPPLSETESAFGAPSIRFIIGASTGLAPNSTIRSSA